MEKYYVLISGMFFGVVIYRWSETWKERELGDAGVQPALHRCARWIDNQPTTMNLIRGHIGGNHRCKLEYKVQFL